MTMRPSSMIVAESLLSFAVPLAWALRELWLLRRRSDGRDDPPIVLPDLPPPPPVDAAPLELPARPRERVRERERELEVA